MSREYLIVSPHYVHYCGGIVTLHKLCHMLNERGYTAYITGRMNPDFNTKSVNDLGQEKLRDLQHNGIIVYPDIIPFNPCRFTNVVRWWLGITQPPRPNELTFAFLDKHQVDYKKDFNLSIWHIEDFFREPEVENRHGACAYSGKGEGMTYEPVPETGSFRAINPNCYLILVGHPPTRQQLADLFKTREVFYCYDNMTILPTEARLCGCPVIMVGYRVIPKGDFEKDEFSMYGLGQYYDKPDIKKLKAELPLFREAYQKRLEKTERELDVFIEETQKWNPDGIYVDDPNPTDPNAHKVMGHQNFELFRTR